MAILGPRFRYEPLNGAHALQLVVGPLPPALEGISSVNSDDTAGSREKWMVISVGGREMTPESATLEDFP